MKLTDDFSLSEFTRSRFANGNHVKPNCAQVYCIRVLCKEVLQPLRDIFGRIKINSGIRDRIVYRRMKKAGYNPSATSDHFCFSDINPYGTGAADIVPVQKGVKLQSVFKWLHDNRDEIPTGQVIIYPDMGFIHIGNAWKSVFGKIPKPKRKERFLVKYKGRGYAIYKEGIKIT
jgi:hypothetical protein